MTSDDTPDWRNFGVIAFVALAITVIGGSLVCTFWLRDLREPSVTFLGSGSDLSVLVTDGPARLLLASGDDPIAFENAFVAAQPLFARRVDLLVLSGDAASLRVPEAAGRTARPRQTATLGTLPPSPERSAIPANMIIAGHQRIELGMGLSVWIESKLPVGADPLETAESWRLTVTHGNTNIVIYSDGDAVPLFPPAGPAAIVAVGGSHPLAFMPDGEGAVFIANATQIGGPALRAALSGPEADPSWTVRVHPGDAVRMAFTADGVDLPSWSAVPVLATS